jgi:hypothetical protein
MNESPESLLKNDRYQVFLLACPASIPISFGSHPWFVVNKKGAVSRWEVFFEANRNKTSWGHLHLNMWPPFQGIEILFPSKTFFWSSRLLGVVEGELAEHMVQFIEASPQTYPYCYHYSLFGPNSNTYAQWVLDRFPECGLSLPWNSFGKSYKIDTTA